MKREELVIKVCGMREADNIHEVEALGVDWLGLIFWPKSSRYVSERPDYLPQHAKRVGVFVDEAVDTVKKKADAYALDLIQLHGSESPDYIRHHQGLQYCHSRRSDANKGLLRSCGLFPLRYERIFCGR